MKSPASVTFGLVEAGLIKTVRPASASGATAKVTPLHTGPRNTAGLAVAMILLKAEMPSGGWQRSSSIMSASLRPPIPPARLTSSTAISAALRGGMPQCAASPVNGNRAPMMIGALSDAADIESSDIAR
jgi:hypothetical protein